MVIIGDMGRCGTWGAFGTVMFGRWETNCSKGEEKNIKVTVKFVMCGFRFKDEWAAWMRDAHGFGIKL